MSGDQYSWIAYTAGFPAPTTSVFSIISCQAGDVYVAIQCILVKHTQYEGLSVKSSMLQDLSRKPYFCTLVSPSSFKKKCVSIMMLVNPKSYLSDQKTLVAKSCMRLYFTSIDITSSSFQHIVFTGRYFYFTGNGKTVDSFVNVSAVHDYRLVRINPRLPGEITHMYQCGENSQNVSGTLCTQYVNNFT